MCEKKLDSGSETGTVRVGDVIGAADKWVDHAIQRARPYLAPEPYIHTHYTYILVLELVLYVLVL
jgi:hypothetical protein